LKETFSMQVDRPLEDIRYEEFSAALVYPCTQISVRNDMPAEPPGLLER
jgi:hypothetical protein